MDASNMIKLLMQEISRRSHQISSTVLRAAQTVLFLIAIFDWSLVCYTRSWSGSTWVLTQYILPMGIQHLKGVFEERACTSCKQMDAHEHKQLTARARSSSQDGIIFSGYTTQRLSIMSLVMFDSHPLHALISVGCCKLGVSQIKAFASGAGVWS